MSEPKNAPRSGRLASARCGRKVTGWAGPALKPKAMKAMISRTVVAVAAAWNAPLKRRLRRWAVVVRQTRRKAIKCSALLGIALPMAGKAPQKYCPKASALTAIGAANPIVAEQRPVQKPTMGW